MVKIQLILRAVFRPHRLAWPRTLPFQGSNTGSNPVGDTSTYVIPKDLRCPYGAHRTMTDPRWNKRYPFWKEHAELNLNGDWDSFFALLSRRLERLVLYGEAGAANPTYLGDCLVTESLGYFLFDRSHSFHEVLRSFFSLSDVHNQIEAELRIDHEVQTANTALQKLSQKRVKVSIGSSPLWVDPPRPTKEEEAAKKVIAQVRVKRIPLCRANVYRVKLSVLQAFFKLILTLPDGQRAFRLLREDVQSFCASSQISYDVALDGTIIRCGIEPLSGALTDAIFRTGDNELDGLLHSARHKYLDRDIRTHRESIEKLWDAWERLKTIEPGKDKPAQILALFSRLPVGTEFREMIDKEGRELTAIGNTFMIRHTEANTIPISGETEVDYLFHRLFSLVWLLLRETGRVS